MSSVNKVIIVGRLGSDPECRFTKGGDAVCNFNMATSEKWKDKSGERQEKTEWHHIVMWGKLAEIATEYLTKGKQVYIEGSLQTQNWEDNDGNIRYKTEVRASNMTMLSGAAGGGHEAPESSMGQRPADDDEDIPF